jgi:AcrR family transcriptional regulator
MPRNDRANDAATAEARSSAADTATSWREVAVARSLGHARVRAEKRVQRFLDAAVELMSSPSDKEFTVQQVVERSGQSLRSFYQYFAGKHELLLALFEEDVGATADHLQQVIEKESDPLERLHRFVVEYYRICQPAQKNRPTKRTPTPMMMAEFGQQLLTDHPKEASEAFVPLVTMLEGLLDDAAKAKVIRPRLRHRQIAGVMLQAIMFNAFAATISGTSQRRNGTDAAEELWGLLFQGIEK